MPNLTDQVETKQYIHIHTHAHTLILFVIKLGTEFDQNSINKEKLH
jgi:hypothetical protein